jgi:hypothetical protein
MRHDPEQKAVRIVRLHDRSGVTASADRVRGIEAEPAFFLFRRRRMASVTVLGEDWTDLLLEELGTIFGTASGRQESNE